MQKSEHWENIYSTKNMDEVSWYQPYPKVSIDEILRLGIPKDAEIIDIGGGDSFLVDSLLELGYTHITVLDISATAIQKAKARLAEKSELVNWIVTDITAFQPTKKYDFWHDRAVFHFLTSEEEQEQYVSLLRDALHEDSNALIGTFAIDGPTKCSGLTIQQYSEESLTQRFSTVLEPIHCFEHLHHTPFNTTQNFQFCSFKRKV
jgi:SAM-dependent methyltransferase